MSNYRSYNYTAGNDSLSAKPLLYSLTCVNKAYLNPTAGEFVEVLKDLCLEIPDSGSMTAILGASGSGKTTLLNLMGGIDTANSGVIRFRGQRICNGDEESLQEFRANNIAFVFQDLNLISHLSALENAALPLLCKGVGRRVAHAKAGENLFSLGLAEVAKSLPRQMSGGQKQRVALARALTAGAQVVLADEPTGSLDPASAELVMRLFDDLSKKRGLPIILVTHNASLAALYCQRLLRMEKGGIKDVTKEFHSHEASRPDMKPGRVFDRTSFDNTPYVGGEI